MSTFTWGGKAVSSIVLLPTDMQPAGAEGDARAVGIIFEDGSLAQNSTYAAVKAQQASFTQQVNVTLPGKLAAATANLANATGLVTMLPA